jgi:hypothetical protein
LWRASGRLAAHRGRRSSSGKAVTLAELEALDEAGRMAHLLPVDALLQSCPKCSLPATKLSVFAMATRSIARRAAGKIRVYADGPDRRRRAGQRRLAVAEKLVQLAI